MLINPMLMAIKHGVGSDKIVESELLKIAKIADSLINYINTKTKNHTNQKEKLIEKLLLEHKQIEPDLTPEDFDQFMPTEEDYKN